MNEDVRDRAPVGADDAMDSAADGAETSTADSAASSTADGAEGARTDVRAAARSFGITPEDYMLPARHLIRTVGPDGRVCRTEGEGPEPGHDYPLPKDEDLLAAYRRLVTGRRLNEQNSALVRQGRMAVYPSSYGQEACQVAASAHLESKDWLFPTYRDAVAVISRGVPPEEAMTLFRGDWHSGYDPREHRVGIESTPLTTQLLHAVGVAHAARMRGEDTVVVALCGDGATSEGDFHEALNFAAVFQLPVIFFVQNNQYAISVPLDRQTAAPSLAHKAVGYGMAGERVDGNDLVALLAVFERAVRLTREGSGPLLIEALTYRIEAHTNADDATRYRDDEEAEHWRTLDPVTRMHSYLTERGLLTEELEEEVRAAAEEAAAELREGMNAEQELDPQELFAHVYSVPTPQLAEQSAQLADELAREEA